MSEQKKDSGWKKAYLVLRWPVAFGLLGISAVFFLIGLLNSLGYNGTTELRAIDKGSSEWTNFTASFTTTDDAARRGAPFIWKGLPPEERKDGALNFDKRLVAAFKYLRDGANNKGASTCGWDGQHELLTIDVEKLGGQWSVYSVPSDKTTPISTIYRGVGARISQADRIKCTEYQNPATLSSGGVCVDARTPKKWPNDTGFPIPLALNAMLNPEPIPFDNVNCRVTCAIDYYPVLGDPVDSKAPTYASSIITAAGFDPASTLSEYQDINGLSRKAARLKSILLAYELMHIDDPGCQSPGGNSGLNRAIPITLIMQDWVRQGLGDNWAELMKIAKSRFPFNFQDSSRLAGLAADPLIDNLGLHFNY